jgi:hypothetical protein
LDGKNEFKLRTAVLDGLLLFGRHFYKSFHFWRLENLIYRMVNVSLGVIIVYSWVVNISLRMLNVCPQLANVSIGDVNVRLPLINVCSQAVNVSAPSVNVCPDLVTVRL